MAHKISVTIPDFEIHNKDIKLEISDSTGMLGELLLSKGSVEWRPSKNSSNRKRLSWAKFAELFEENGTSIKKISK
jgi:hypothetical protein